MNHLDYFLKSCLRRRIRERKLENKQHLEKLKQDLEKAKQLSQPQVQSAPQEKNNLPFSAEGIQELDQIISEYIAGLPVLPPDEIIEEQQTMMEDTPGQRWIMAKDRTMERISPAPTGMATSSPYLVPNFQEAQQLLQSHFVSADMSLDIIGNICVPSHGLVPPIESVTPVSAMDIEQEAVGGQIVGIEPPQIEPAAQISTALPDVEMEAVDQQIVAVQPPQETVETMMQNLFQSQPDAVHPVTILVDCPSFSHTLPLEERIGAGELQGIDNITRRVRPVRAVRQIRYLESPTPSPPRKRTRRPRRKPADALPPAEPEIAALPPTEPEIPRADAGNLRADLEELSVAPLPAAEPFQDQEIPPAFDDQNLADLSEDRKRDFIWKLQELQAKLGNVMSFTQICPFQSTLRKDAARAFKFLIELCCEKKIELLQEIPMKPDKLIVKIIDLENS